MDERIRKLKLTNRAREALDRSVSDVVKPGTLIFGRHDVLRYLRAAATEAGIDPHKATWIAPCDLRHARVTHLLEMGAALVGAAYTAGHTRLTTTTNRYVNVSQAAGDAAANLSDASDLAIQAASKQRLG